MSNKENFDLDALVAAASSLSADLRDQFVELIPPELQTQVLQRLEEVDPSLATREDIAGTDVDGSKTFLPPTIITVPDSAPGTKVEIEPKKQPKRRAGKTSNQVSLVKLHARGAVGEVFVAYDEKLTRELALKRVRNDLPNSELRLERFIREAKITANLQHPGIVPIYNLNVSKSDAHYTMPLVSGSTLSERIEETHQELEGLPGRDIWISKMRPLLRSFIAVCNAIDYAHSQNVLHRDLKPANIIIGSQGQTLVLDWGCAKDLDEEESLDEDSNTGIEDDELAQIYGIEPGKRMTVMGSVIGTIAFMSPEQASGDSRNIGKPSDIFGLGATLFNLLTNEVAFECADSSESSVKHAIESVNRGEHRSIGDVDTRVPAPLAAICSRSMAYDPDARYSTAGDLARDIDAFLAGEKVSAWREPITYRAMRFVKRHRTAFATLAGTLLVGVLSLAYFAWSTNRQSEALAGKNSELADMNAQLVKSADLEKRAAATAQKSELQSKQQLYETEMLLASEASSEPGGVGRMRQLVQRWSAPKLAPFRGWEFQHLNDLGNREYWKTSLNATANKIVFTRDNPKARVFDTRSKTLLAIDADGRRVLERLKLSQNTTAVDFNRDQSLMAIGLSDGTVKVLHVGSDKEPVEVVKFDTPVLDVRWNIGGDYIAACIVELTVATREKKVVARDGWILNPCWSHEGQLLAYIGPENTIVVKDQKSDKTTRFEGHQLFVETLQWHPSKHFLLSSSADGSVRIWNTDTAKEVRQLLGHGGHVYAAAWNSDGSKVVSGGLPEDKLHVWDVSSLGNGIDRELQDRPAFDWHPDGKQLAVAEGADILIQDDSLETRLIPSVDSSQDEIYGVAYSAEGNQIACISLNGRIWTIDAASGKLLQIFDTGSDENLYPDITSKAIEFSPDGKFLAGVGGGGKVRVWDLSTGENIAKQLPSSIQKTLVLQWSPVNSAGQSRLAFAGTGSSIFIFDTEQEKVVQRIIQYGWKTGLAWSPDGSKIGVTSQRSIDIWDIESRQTIGTCEGPSTMIRDISWSKSQDRIAALTEKGLVCFWNDESFAYCGKFKLHQRLPYSVRWSPDGTRLASTARHGRIVLQSAKTDEESPQPTE